MWAASFWPNSYYQRGFWPKAGQVGAVAPLPGGGNQYLAIMGVGVFLLCAVFLARSAAGHGDAEWIARGGFTGDDAVHCCGPADCERVPAGAVHRTAGGWMLPSGQVFADGQSGLYESDDLSWWWCLVQGTTHYRCLFRAQSAT